MERVRRKKTAAERRAQRARAEGRRLQHVLLALNEVHSHRGGCLTKLGKAFKVALEGLDPANVWQQTQAAAQPEAAAPMSSPGNVGQTQAAAQPNNNAGPTDKRHSDMRGANGPTPSRPGGWPKKFVSGASAAAGGVAPEQVLARRAKAAAQPEAAAPMSSPGNVGQTQAAAQPNNNAGPTDKRHSDMREANGPTPSRPGGWPEKFVSGASAAAGGVAPEPLDRLSGIACGAAPHSPWRAAPMLSPVEQQTQAAAQPEVPAPMSSPGNVGQTQAAAQPNTSGVALEPLGSAFGAVPHSPRQAAPMQSSAFWAFGAAPHRSWQAAPMSSPANVGQQTQAAAQPEAAAPMSSPGNVGQTQAAAQPNTSGVALEPLGSAFGAVPHSPRQAAPMQSSAFWAFGAAPHRSWQAAPMSSPTNVGQQTQAAAQPEAPAQISSPGNVGQKQAAAQPNTCGVAPEPLDRCSDTPFGAAQRSRKQLHQG